MRRKRRSEKEVEPRRSLAELWVDIEKVCWRRAGLDVRITNARERLLSEC